MELLKRILAVMVMAASVLLIFVLGAGSVGNWMANKTVTDATVQVLTSVDRVLGRTERCSHGPCSHGSRGGQLSDKALLGLFSNQKNVGGVL